MKESRQIHCGNSSKPWQMGIIAGMTLLRGLIPQPLCCSMMALQGGEVKHSVMRLAWICRQASWILIPFPQSMPWVCGIRCSMPHSSLQPFISIVVLSGFLCHQEATGTIALSKSPYSPRAGILICSEDSRRGDLFTPLASSKYLLVLVVYMTWYH